MFDELLKAVRAWSESNMAAEDMSEAAVEAAAACDELEKLKEAIQNIMTYLNDAFCDTFDRLKELAEECTDFNHLAYEREREKEAIPREESRARARYKAHCATMAAHKARQHMRRRKYRSGANAGWY